MKVVRFRYPWRAGPANNTRSQDASVQHMRRRIYGACLNRVCVFANKSTSYIALLGWRYTYFSTMLRDASGHWRCPDMHALQEVRLDTSQLYIESSQPSWHIHPALWCQQPLPHRPYTCMCKLVRKQIWQTNLASNSKQVNIELKLQANTLRLRLYYLRFKE
jgi:hypothetical protein